MTLQSVAEECQRIINLRHEANKIKEKDYSHTHACRLVKYKEKKKRRSKLNPTICLKFFRGFNCEKNRTIKLILQSKKQLNENNSGKIFSAENLDQAHKRKLVYIINNVNPKLQLDTITIAGKKPMHTLRHVHTNIFNYNYNY